MGQGLGHGLWDDEKRADIRIEGGSTLKTFNLPADAERVQYALRKFVVDSSRHFGLFALPPFRSSETSWYLR